MAIALPEPVTEFAAFLVQRECANGTTQKEIAARAKIAQGLISAIKNLQQHVTVDSSGPGLARAFRYEDFAEFVVAAFAWSRDRASEPTKGAHVEASRAARTAQLYGATAAQIGRVLERYKPEDYAQFDGDWWLLRFLEEKKIDQDITMRARAEKKARRVPEIKNEPQTWRAAAAAKKELSRLEAAPRKKSPGKRRAS